MQLLVVHHDAEIGEQLLRIVEDYTAHTAHWVENDAAALGWARTHARCGLLLAQLQGPGVDALALGGPVSEIFPGLQILFLPPYRAEEQRLDIAQTKVFPEPINGERLLEAIEIAARATPGAPDLFHIMDLLQMCCLSWRSGAVQIVKETQSGIVFLRDGRIVHAESAIARGTDALLEIARWNWVEFAYDESVRAPETISIPWDEALTQEVIRHEEEKARQAAATPQLDPAPDGAPAPKPAKRGFFGALKKH
jgi:DNA-binding response OmpR family regulator